MASAERSDADLYQAKRTPNCQRRKILASLKVQEITKNTGETKNEIQRMAKYLAGKLHKTK